MLGLRKGLLVRKRSSASSILTTEGQSDDADDNATRPTMETIRAGLQESANGLSSKKIHKPSGAMSVSVSVVKSDTDSARSETTVSLADDSQSTTALTVLNGHSTTSTTTTTIHITRIIDISRAIRGHVCKLGDYDETFFKALTLESYLEYISDERLIHMPRRGSDWDRVLRAAQCFGFQLWRFGASIGQFCSGTQTASVTALGTTQILLEVCLLVQVVGNSS